MPIALSSYFLDVLDIPRIFQRYFHKMAAFNNPHACALNLI